jgi:signal transduction histidine kinase
VGERRPTLVDRIRERSSSVRVRTTAAAVIVLGVAYVVAAVAMVLLLRRQLTADVRVAARLTGRTIARDMEAGRLRRPIVVGDPEDEFVQVLDQEGNVVASSARVRGQPAITLLAPGDAERIEGLRLERSENDPFQVVAVDAETRRGQPRTVIVGRTLETVDEFSGRVGSLLAVGTPILLVIVGLMTWRVVGRALRPVEAIRAEVDAISNKELHRRVPDPGGADEIARLAATMNQMLARLQEGQARERRFISDASHELRSPVTTIRQHAEVARRHPTRTTIEELASVVLEEDERLQHLVEDLLLLTQMDEGTLRLRTESVDLDDLLFEEADRMRATTALRVDTSAVSAGRVSGDREQLSKLVRNLTGNAARHAASTVALSLRDESGEVVLIVEDDGEGIPLPERERIFERFVRLDEARDRDSGGSGLGLAIVAQIAAAHGAAVRVRDGRVGGAHFEVRFPAPGP